MNIDEKGKFDAEVCENIPLNYTNLLQGYGYLLVTDYNLKIIQWSENFTSLVGLEAKDFQDRNFKDFLNVFQYEEIKNKVANKKVQDNIPIDLRFTAGPKVTEFKALLHIKDKYFLFELEQNHDHAGSPFSKLYQEIKYFSAVLKVAKSVEAICQIASENLRALSGFDRVMIYRFDEEWNGQVIGEALESGMQEYLGFHFPSSDIPKQARQLYLKNPYRMIPDTNSNVQALIPDLNKAINGLTDLSDCNLRSVARVHIEYLNNMGVHASMSVPIIKDGELWGLIACHHLTPKHVSYESRSAFEILSTLISELVSARESQFQLTQRTILFKKLSGLIKFMSHKNDFVSGLLNGEDNILHLLNMTGVVVVYENSYNFTGETPPEAFVEELITWHNKEHQQHIFISHELPLIYLPAKDYANIASGIIFLPLSPDRKYYVIGFRKECVQSIKWAGNPLYSKGLSNNINELHPRNSFGLYNETKRNVSVKWSSIEVEIAETLLKSILEIILKSQIMKRIIAEEEVYKLSIVAQKTGNAVITLDQHGQVEWVNESFTGYSGMYLDDVKGKKLTGILKNSDNIEDVTELLNPVNREKNGFKRDILIQKDGKDHYLTFNVSRVRNEDKAKEKFIIIGTDFTLIKEKSIALKSINQQLDEYTYIVSHDLKAPLKGIEGLVNILEENHSLPQTGISLPEEKENAEVFTMIHQAISRMDGFISGLLSQAKEYKTELSEVDLNTLIEDTLKWLNPDRQKFRFLIQTDLPVIKTNHITLQQIFSNLLSNAIRYGQSKNELSTIEVGIISRNDNFIRFYVKDNGNGIEKEYHERIFDLYDTGKESDSTGIGLHTTKTLIEQNMGRIWVESEPGEGAVFKFDWAI